jgi:hypothetical protein
VRICWSTSCFDASHCSGKQLPGPRLYANQSSGFSSPSLSLVPGGAEGHPGSVRGLFSARWPCLASREKTPSRSPRISHGLPRPVRSLAISGPIENNLPIPHLEQFLVKSNNFLLENFRPNLLGERGWLHALIHSSRDHWKFQVKNEVLLR